ncbi:MAG: GntG family PLP-dependent aldolase [Burkholderiales bacterium]|nr:GntG family PLP-dependent aldolase [Burkholderiales bacterium]
MIDLRSDTVTQPTPAMLEAMRTATSGDDSRDGDPAVRALEALAAELTGKQAAAFMPSGTMTNLVALLTHARRGGEVLIEAGAHILNSEKGGIAAVAGLMHRGLRGERGAMDLDMLRAAISPATALICLETTHNGAGGTVLPLAHMQTVHELAGKHRLPVHTDGARLFNAATALGLPAKDIAQHTDSVCFCISKGLSAPVGSLLCGSAGFIERSRINRRMLGGNMRQSGMLAAAGIVALETMTARLGEDHEHAKLLAGRLHGLDAVLADPRGVETNIIRVNLGHTGMTAATWSALLKEKGVLASPCDPHTLRLVTHRHILRADIDAVITAFSSVWHDRSPVR